MKSCDPKFSQALLHCTQVGTAAVRIRQNAPPCSSIQHINAFAQASRAGIQHIRSKPAAPDEVQIAVAVSAHEATHQSQSNESSELARHDDRLPSATSCAADPPIAGEQNSRETEPHASPSHAVGADQPATTIPPEPSAAAVQEQQAAEDQQGASQPRRTDQQVSVCAKILPGKSRSPTTTSPQLRDSSQERKVPVSRFARLLQYGGVRWTHAWPSQWMDVTSLNVPYHS